MSDDDATAVLDAEEASAETEAAETEAVEVTDLSDEAEAVEADAEEGDSDTEEAEETEEEITEVYEFDFGGNKLTVEKDQLPEDVAQQVDEFTKGTWRNYNEKMQGVAADRKELEASQERLSKLQSMNGEMLDTYSRGLQLNTEVQQLSQIDVATLWQTDPDQARQVSDTIAAKQAELNATISKVNQQEMMLTGEQEQERSRLIESGKAQVEKLAPGFTADVDKVIDYVVERFGMDREEASRSWALNPITAAMARDSMRLAQLETQAKKKATTKKVPKPVTPGKATSKAKANVNPDKMSIEQWTAWRNAQLAKKQA